MKVEKIASSRGYIVTEDGKFLNPNGSEIGRYNDDGYLYSSFRVDKRCIRCYAHRLQAYQKYGDLLYQDGILTRHLNGDSRDNSWVNISIGTHSQNMMDIPEDIRVRKARYASSFVTKYNHSEVIEFYNSCRSYKDTMKKFKISSKGTLYYIINK